MRIETQSDSPTETTLVVSVATEDMSASRQKVEKRLTANIKLPGFREGAAPAGLAAKQIDQQVLLNTFLNEFVPKAVVQALEVKEIRPVLPPNVSVTKFVPFNDLEITVKAEHLGRVELVDLKELEEKLPEAKVTAEEVQQVLKRLQADAASYSEVKRPAASGDRVIIDFSGTDQQGKPIEGADAKNYPLVLGSQAFIPGFEEKLLNRKAGEDVDFSLDFPKNYAAAHLAGASVDFKVSVKKVEKADLPAIDDALAARIGDHKTLAQLKKFIKNKSLEDKRRQARAVFQGRIVARLAEKSLIEVPPGLLKLEVERLDAEHEAYLKDSQLSLEQWLKDMSLSEQEHREKLELTAANRVKGGIVLREFAQTEGLSVSEEEIAAELGKHPPAEEERQQVELKNDIHAHLLTQKSLEGLADKVLKTKP